MELTGRVTANAVIKTLPDERQVINFTIAINDYYKPKGEVEGKEFTLYVSCSYWRSTGVATKLSKGTIAEVSGRMYISVYNGADNEPKASLNFHCNTIKAFGGGKEDVAGSNIAQQQTAMENIAALRTASNSIKIRHTNNAKQKLEQAHQLMGITNTLSAQLENIFNDWARVRITDKEVYKLMQLALVPNKEVLRDIRRGKEDELSTHFLNICNRAYEYALGNETQQLETTRGTLFGACNGVTGYFQNVRSYKDNEAKMKSLVLGGTAQLRTQAAFDLCTAYASKGADAFLLN